MPLSVLPSRLATVALATLLFGLPVGLSAQGDPAGTLTAKKAEVQKKLAASSEIQKRFRLDGATIADGKLKLSGVFLEPGFTPPEANKGEPPAKEPFAVLEDELTALLKEVVKEPALKLDLSGVTRIEGKQHPYVVLQKAANDAGATNSAADQMRLDGCHFDGTGTLVLVGAIGDNAATEAWLKGAIDKDLASHPAVKHDGKLDVSAAGIKRMTWKMTPAAIQAAFANSKSPGLEKLRVDRVYLAHNPDNADPVDRWTTLRLTLNGVRLGEVPVDAELLQSLCRKQWEELFKGSTRVQMNASALVGPGITEPIDRLRKTIAARPALDGVRLDAGATFGSEGELLLAGVRPKLSDPKAAETLKFGLTEAFKDVISELAMKNDASAARFRALQAGPGISIANLTEADTRRVLRELREWARTNRDDLRLSRLYFGADGGLKLICEAPTEKDFEDVRAKFREVAPQFFPAEVKPPAKGSDDPPPAGRSTDPVQPIARVSALQEPNNPAQAAPLLPPPVVETSLIPAFTPFLRQQLASDPKQRWSTVLIERGYFDDEGRYTLNGVVDGDPQKTELVEFVQRFSADPKWSAYFKTPQGEPKELVLALDVIPMADLMARVQRVTPAYPVFDGVRVTNAAYDKDANLVLGAHMVGRPNLKEGQKTLAELISKHPDFSRRLVKVLAGQEPKLRIEGKPPEPLPPNDQLADFSVGYGATALAQGELVKAKEWLDVGLLHYPNDSSIWFLSAYYNHMLGDRELVQRDLRRLIDIEGRLDFNGPLQRKRRYLAAKDLQGEKRDELEKFWLVVWKEAKDAPKVMTMVPEK